MASTPGRRGSITSNNSKSPHRQWIPIVSPPPPTTTTTTTNNGNNNNGNNNNGNNNNGNNNNNTKYGNKHVDAELEALKQRGLAKMLNKHFTETALQLEQEKAAADAALRDLEERKSRTSEYTGPNYNHVDTSISPLDEMCLQANRWRAECRRKERETMLLYQRYVHRFGDTLHSIVPRHTPDSPTTSAPPPRKAPATATATTTTTTTTTATSTPSSLVPNMAKQIEATLEEYLKQGAVSVPSMQTLGKDETYQNLQKKEEEQFRNFYRRQLEQKGVDVKYPGFSITNRPDYPGFPINTIEEKRNVSNSDDNNDDGDDDESVMSELTTLQSVILQDCERSVVTYLQEEHQKIQSLLRGDDDHDMDENESAVSQAESMVQQMEEILAEYQNARPSNNKNNSKHAKSQHPPREYPTDNPNEHWTVYYDEFYQQDYYHEKFTNRTQWEPPMSSSGSSNSRSGRNHFNDSTSCSSAATLTVSEVMPDMRVYRQRRQAKRRSRRTQLLVWSTVMVAVVAMVYQYDRQGTVLRAILPGRWAKYILPPTAEPAKSRAMDYSYSQGNEVEKEPTVVMTQPPKAYEPAIPAPLLVPSQQQIAVPMVTTTTADDDKYDGHDNALATNLHRPWFCSFPLASWLDHRCQESRDMDATAVATSTDVDDKNDEYAMMHRPWLCNLPLACWLHRRCWILAKRKPLFNTQELIDRMFQ